MPEQGKLGIALCSKSLKLDHVAWTKTLHKFMLRVKKKLHVTLFFHLLPAELIHFQIAYEQHVFV